MASASSRHFLSGRHHMHVARRCKIGRLGHDGNAQVVVGAYLSFRAVQIGHVNARLFGGDGVNLTRKIGGEERLLVGFYPRLSAIL